MATPRKEPVQEEAGYCKSSVLANLFDVSNQWIGQLTRDGVLRKHRVKAGPRYNVVEATRAYCNYLKAKAAGREEKGNPEAEKNKLDADIRLKRAKADIAELEVKELQGKMHRSEDVAAMTEDLIYTIRSILLALPRRLAVDVVTVLSPSEAADIIRKEVHKVMEELSNYRYDAKKYEERVRERRSWDNDGWDDDD